MLLSTLKKTSSLTRMASFKHKVFRPVLMTCLLTLASNLPAQAAARDNVVSVESSNLSTQQPQKAGATSGLQLISLQDSQQLDDSSNGERLELDASSTLANQSENLVDDDIDALGDETINPLVDESDYSYDEIPAEVAKVSLKAISPETLKTFVAVVDLVRREYIEAVNDETLFDNAMSGMLTKLDSHAEFLDAEAYENLRAFTQGDVGDVGIEAAYDNEADYWVVTKVIAESPADKKGITIGDYLHQIGEFKLDEGRQANDVRQLLTGVAGSQIDVVVSKAGRRKRAITLQRNNARAQAIETRLVAGIAIIKVPTFQDTTREKIVQSLIDLKAPVSAVLIDLRDNPGGVLTAAVDVASLFMANSDVVQVKGRQGDPRILSTKGNAILEPLPVFILQNRYSASAAEVLASSLQAKERATIIGETSYGKGSVQSVIALNDEQAVKLTVAHYLTAKGVKIDKVGVQPDIRLSGNEGSWEQQALDLLRPQIKTSGIKLVRKGSVEDQAVP